MSVALVLFLSTAYAINVTNWTFHESEYSFQRGCGAFDAKNNSIWLIDAYTLQTTFQYQLNDNAINRRDDLIYDLGLRRIKCTSANNIIYMIGEDRESLPIYTFNMVTQQQSHLVDNSVIKPRYNLCLSSITSPIDNHLYLLITGGGYSTDFFIYDVDADEWVPNAPNMFYRRHLNPCCTCNDYLYVFNGNYPNMNQPSNIQKINVRNPRDIVNRQWIVLQDTLASGGTWSDCTVLGNYIFVTNNGCVQYIDTIDDSQHVVKPLTMNSWQASFVATNDRLFVFGMYSDWEYSNSLISASGPGMLRQL